MSWRTVVISRRCKLDYKMGYLEIRSDETRKVFLDEIAILVIENPAVSLTCVLLEAMTEKKIRVFFCDQKRNPMAELMPYHGSHDSAGKIRRQAKWKDETKSLVWQRVIREKIGKQAEFLAELGKEREHELLRSYIPQVEPGDVTNREGHAAKVYFNAIFGMNFTRGSDCVANAALNYGYAVLLAAVNREINAYGYITQLGVFHDNQFNHFNLSCDLMEPFRVMVDRTVIPLSLSDEEFTNESKHSLWNVLNGNVMMDGKKQTVMNALHLYLKTVLNALDEDDPELIRFYEVI